MQHKDSTAAAGILDVQSENGVSDLLKRAIERHETAYAYFSSTVYLLDDGIIGREATVAEKATYDAASNAESMAMSDLCYFPARTPEDMGAKARHLRKYHTNYFGFLEDYQVENLLRSMLPDDERDALDDGAEEPTEHSDLAGLIAAHKEVTGLVNAYEGGHDDDEIGEHCDKQAKLALTILAYRPTSRAEAFSKVKFLREWTSDTQLTAAEENALAVSMLPEGGEA